MVVKPLDALDMLAEPVHPSIAAAREQYAKDFDTLLAHRQATPVEKWVAYHGESRVGFGTSKAELVHVCREAGLPLSECLIVGIDRAVLNPNG